VVLKVDTSETLLRPTQLAALVEAVRDAADHDEDLWVEWKSGYDNDGGRRTQLDLTAAAGLAQITKAVLGMANRDSSVTPADLEMLQNRLLERTPTLQMTVAAVPATTERTPDIPAAVEQWVEQRRPGAAGSAVRGPQATVARLRRPQLRYPRADLLGRRSLLDSHTEDEYIQEVEEYLSGPGRVSWAGRCGSSTGTRRRCCMST
jgi:hypothetical protein